MKEFLQDALKLRSCDGVHTKQQLHVAQGAVQLSSHSSRYMLQELLSLHTNGEADSHTLH